MSNDDKTIITFRKDGVPSPSAGASNSGFQRPMPGGRGAPMSNATALPPQPVLSVAPQSSPLPGVLPVASAVQAPQPITQSPQPLANPRPLIAPKVNAQVYVNPLVHCANDLVDRMAFLRSGMLNNGQPLSDGLMDNDPAIFRDEIIEHHSERLPTERRWQCRSHPGQVYVHVVEARGQETSTTVEHRGCLRHWAGAIHRLDENNRSMGDHDLVRPSGSLRGRTSHAYVADD